MAFGKSFIKNPASEGNMIERRDFYVRDDDFHRMTQVVPFTFGEPTATAWWQHAVGAERNEGDLFCIGVTMRDVKDRPLPPLNGDDRRVVAGDTPETKIEVRVFRTRDQTEKAYKVCPKSSVPGKKCMVWWEVPDKSNPDVGIATLCTGLVPVKGKVVVEGDGLDGASRESLLTTAGREGVKTNKDMSDGEIVSHIRAKRELKSKKPVAASV